MRAFLALMRISCLALAVASVVGIASGGYRPERYGGGFDPVRAAMIVSLAASAVGFALVARAGLAAVWSDKQPTSLSAVAFWTGLAVATLAILLIFASMPASSRPMVVPVPLRVLLFAGLGILAAGVIPPVVRGAAAAHRRRDRGLLVALLLLAVLVVLRFTWRG
jgi:hypothetical protein